MNGDVALNGTVPDGVEATVSDDIEIRTEEGEAADVTDLVQGALDRYGLFANDSDPRGAARRSSGPGAARAQDA
jgi:hypothetical protein